MTNARVTRKLEARRCTETIRDLLLGYRARMEHELRGSSVTLPQLRMLKAIHQQQTEASAASIARLCHITPQTLHTMLARATREGWITRGISEKNSRFVTAALTPKGAAILREGIHLAEAIEAEIWRGVSLDSMQAMRTTLEYGLANLERTSSRPIHS